MGPQSQIFVILSYIEKRMEKELDQQKESYASNPEVRERKKKWYEHEKKEQKIWEKQQIEKRRMEHAQERLISDEEKAREKNSEGYRWLKNSFQKSFEKLKTIDSKTEDMINLLEKRMKEKFIKIDKEIDYKIEKYKAEMEKGFDDIRTLYPIFRDFTTEGYV